MNNTEIIFFLHICRNTNYFKKIPSSIFKDKYLSALYSLTKDFYLMYNKLPFKENSNDTSQIREIINSKPSLALLNDELSKEENIDMFLNNASLILGHDYNRYIPEYVDANMIAWMDWEKFQQRYIEASTYIKSHEPTPSNYKEIIKGAQEIMNSYESYDDDDDDIKNILDPETYRIDESVDCVPSSWDSLDLLFNDKGTGSKNGNLHIFVGAPNIGKTILLGNVAEAYAQTGHNVLFISLEMSEKDMAERMGSNIFNIKMDDYENRVGQIENIIADFKNKPSITPRGEIWLKRMYEATPNEIHQLRARKEKELGVKIHVVVVDYLGEMGNDQGTKQDNAYTTYLYHKQNASALFNNAGRGDYIVITAHQSSEIDVDAEDITLADLSESKGILHRPDSVIGIIQSRAMKQNREYRLKSLKARHSKYKNYSVDLNIDYQYMRMTCGGLRDADTMGGEEIETISNRQSFYEEPQSDSPNTILSPNTNFETDVPFSDIGDEPAW